MSGEVLFTQKLVSKDSDNKVDIEWTVENNSDKLIENVSAISQCNNHDFGDLEAGEVKSIIFDVEIPTLESLKTDFGDDAVLPDKITFGSAGLTYSVDGVSAKTKSNTLEI